MNYRAKQGKSLKITIDLYCSISPKMGNLMTPVLCFSVCVSFFGNGIFQETILVDKRHTRMSHEVLVIG